jgi:ParB family chromosome partitioning protein
MLADLTGFCYIIDRDVMLVQIKDIKIKRRVRKDLGNLEDLKDSLRTYGLMNPITLNSRYELIAGERRLQAATQLGWTSINANIIDNISEVDQLEMEIEENNQRKEFTDAELMEGYKRLQKLRNPGFFYRIYLFFKHLFEKIREFFHSK